MPVDTSAHTSTLIVRAYCTHGHCWVTTATITRWRPRYARHDLISETLTIDHCPQCSGRVTRYQDNRQQSSG